MAKAAANRPNRAYRTYATSQLYRKWQVGDITKANNHPMSLGAFSESRK